ncbi:uncharacterized protein LOC112089193 [Eutrema salsugineum]|uniref:uncharacterized protein LOC112089193 n=1 Tax=Eutrema salsugineum TaxID=72664 RepID=UPI000CED37D4|nr:uncharacterized protein LOC112089193 [Eutrema salsugineum]
MNILSHMLNKAVEGGIFGYHPGCEDLKLLHLCFADDLLIFLEGSEKTIEGVLAVLGVFEKISGLAVNIDKTSMFCSGVPDDMLHRIHTKHGLTPSSLPVRYLCLPLCSKRLSIKDCDPMLSQIQTKLASWSLKLLSMAGRLQLISSVISGITVSPLPSFGMVLRIFTREQGFAGRIESLWVVWVRKTYLSVGSFWSQNDSNNRFSWMFCKLLRLRSKATTFLSIEIGNGEDTFFWWDPWTPFGSLISFLGDLGPSRLGIPVDSLVSDLISDRNWILPPARSDTQTQLYSFITQIIPSTSSDRPVNIPKHTITSWLFMLNRNPTLIRISSWAEDVDTTCLLCGLEEESRDHLFFECQFSSEVWRLLMSFLFFPNAPSNWSISLAWIESFKAPKHLALAIRQGWQASIYEIWLERNRRFHQGLSLRPRQILLKILLVLRHKAKALQCKGSKYGTPLSLTWQPP